MTNASIELAKTYDPGAVERDWFERWDRAGAFTAVRDPARQPYTIIMPPPNVTGELHMGHALFVTVEDIFTRWRRMQGYSTLWLPGADHAGIAGQWVVEKELADEGLTRHELGRDEFLRRVWAWMDRYRGRIREQLRILGASCDWTRFHFTMDEGPSRAVREAFKRLFDRGLIYRGSRLINWCPRCMTALSDLEVNHDGVQGSIWYVRYRLVGAGERSITVATTRPETILGDTAIAVHPEDPRYRELIGQFALVPVLGRRIPIVADSAVDPAFGSGAVKVTPAHDPVDFQIGQRHHLPAIGVMNLDGTMNDAAGPFQGQGTAQAREGIVTWLATHGQLERTETHTRSVGHCDRCDTIIEPLISEQWFVKMAPLAAPAIAAARSGDVQFLPERFTATFLHWMENIHDWCISRQLWWGHRIPVWHCQACGGMTATAATTLDRCGHCGATTIEQDPDVLDTWFSSGLWPMSTLGWPDETEDLAYFYPTSLLETGYDILFHWVARMIFFGLEFRGEVPFTHVFFHGTVRDEQGKRMSKTKGNVLDPTEVTARYGADALRFTLITAGAPGADMKLSISAVEANRNFANKLWQIARFVLGSVSVQDVLRDETGAPAEPAAPRLADQWMLDRLSAVTLEVTRQLDAFQPGKAADLLYEFLWNSFADWYIEAAKATLQGGDEAAKRETRQTLVFTLERALRLLHPVMPFITEELWQALPHAGDLLIGAPWPAPTARYPTAARAFGRLQEVTRAIRNARAELNVEPGRRIAAAISGPEATSLEPLRRELALLARVDPARLAIGHDVAPSGEVVTLPASDTTIYLPLADLADVAAERSRLAQELAAAEAEGRRAAAMLDNAEFTSRAPERVVQAQRDRLASATARQELLRARLAELAASSLQDS